MFFEFISYILLILNMYSSKGKKMRLDYYSDQESVLDESSFDFDDEF
jgi:hypothetical protein